MLRGLETPWLLLCVSFVLKSLVFDSFSLLNFCRLFVLFFYYFFLYFFPVVLFLHWLESVRTLGYGRLWDDAITMAPLRF